MGKFACFWGFHDWEILKTCPGKLIYSDHKINAEIRLEQCKNCSVRRGVADSGTIQEVLDPGYVERQLKAHGW